MTMRPGFRQVTHAEGWRVTEHLRVSPRLAYACANAPLPTGRARAWQADRRASAGSSLAYRTTIRYERAARVALNIREPPRTCTVRALRWPGQGMTLTTRDDQNHAVLLRLQFSADGLFIPRRAGMGTGEHAFRCCAEPGTHPSAALTGAESRGIGVYC